MDNNNFGLSFAPMGGNRQIPGSAAGGSQPAGPVNPIQDAIRVLSLKIPKVVGAAAPAPQALLNSPGMAGAGPTGGLPSNLQAMLSSFFQPPINRPGPVQSSPFQPGDTPINKPGPVATGPNGDTPTFGDLSWEEILRRLFNPPMLPGTNPPPSGPPPPPNFSFTPPTSPQPGPPAPPPVPQPPPPAPPPPAPEEPPPPDQGPYMN